MEQITGYVKLWTEFVERHPDLTIEIRTKSANLGCWKNLTPHARVIYALTLSPERVVTEYEHKTPSLKRRIQSAVAAQQEGFSVRLCFDPMIYCTDWRYAYEEMLQQVFAQIDMERLVDVSVGSFRVSQDYLKKMRKNQPTSPVVQFPYQNDHGVYHYPDALLEEMETYLVGQLTERLPPERIFRWNQ
jgi:spore photoproduct lyase